MTEIIKESVKNYLSSLEADFSECNEINLNGFVSKVEIEGDKKADVYVVIPKEKLDLVSEYWFSDTNYDVADLTNEIANIIVGNAKVVASKKGIDFNISVP